MTIDWKSSHRMIRFAVDALRGALIGSGNEPSGRGETPTNHIEAHSKWFRPKITNVAGENGSVGILARVDSDGVTLVPLFDSRRSDNHSGPLRIDSTTDESSIQTFITSWAIDNAVVGMPVVLTFDSRWAHLFVFAADETPETGQAIAFEIESQLLQEAESMTVSVRSDGNLARCLAVENTPLCDWIDRLESAGLPIHHVVAESLAIAQQAIELNDFTSAETVWVLPDSKSDGLAGTGWVEVLRTAGGLPVAWSRCLDRAAEIDRELSMQVQGIPPIPAAADESTVNAKHLRKDDISGDNSSRDVFRGRLDRLVGPAGRDSILLAAAAAILSGGIIPWFECRRGVLARHDRIRPIRGTLENLSLAVSIGLIILSAAIGLRGQRFINLADRSEVAAKSAYAELFPGQRMPTSPLRRLRGERRKWAGSGSPNAGIEPPINAAPLLVSVVQSLTAATTAVTAVPAVPAAPNNLGQPDESREPGHSRLIVRSFRIDNGVLHLELTCTAMADVDEFIDSLQSAGWQTDPPSTRTGADGHIRVTIAGRQLVKTRPRTASRTASSWRPGGWR